MVTRGDPDIAYFDGSCKPVNPGGWGGWGFVVCDSRGNKVFDGCGAMRPRKDMTNNVAEYAAAGACIKAYKDSGRKGPLLMRGDSKLVVMQMRGEWVIRKGSYVYIAQRLLELVDTCYFELDWEWIPRKRNTVADELSTKSIPGEECLV